MDAGVVSLHAKIKSRFTEMDADGVIRRQVIDTTPGRMKIAAASAPATAIGHRLIEKALTKKKSAT